MRSSKDKRNKEEEKTQLAQKLKKNLDLFKYNIEKNLESMKTKETALL